MGLTIEYVVDLNVYVEDEEGDRDLRDCEYRQIGHEPNSDLVQYFLEDDELRNVSCNIVLGDYSNVEWREELPRVTNDKITRFGVKSLVGIGSYGFYEKDEDESIKIKIPFNWVNGEEPPIFSVGQTDKTITYVINNPELIKYEAFRIIFKQNTFAHEFITYDLQGECEKPYDMQGEYEVTCIGYRYDVQEFSRPTEPININVTLRSDAPMPVSYVEEAPIDDKLYGRYNAQWHEITDAPVAPPIIIDKVSPIMSSNTSPAPFVVSASSIFQATNDAWVAFNGNKNIVSAFNYSGWCSNGSSFNAQGIGNAWLQVDLGTPYVVMRYKLQNCRRNDSNNICAAVDFTLQGSNDGSQWTVLHTVTGRTDTDRAVETTYEVYNSVAYRYYRLDITKAIPSQTSNRTAAVGQLELWGYPPPP